MKATLSVIIPVYGYHPYFEVCVESVLSQTFRDVEVILVNDGSPDDVMDVCRSIADDDNRVKIIDKENGGPNSARNAGIKACRGEYVLFIDNDDYLYDPETIERNIALIESKQTVDVVQFPRYRDNGTVTKSGRPEGELIHTKEEKLRFILSWERYGGSELWGKIYRRDVFDGYVLDEGVRFAEDTYCMLDLIWHCRGILISGDGGYVYRMREGSAIHSEYTGSKCLDSFRVSEKEYRLIIAENGYYNEKVSKFGFLIHLLTTLCVVFPPYVPNMAVDNIPYPGWTAIFRSKWTRRKISVIFCKILGVKVFLSIVKLLRGRSVTAGI